MIASPLPCQPETSPPPAPPAAYRFLEHAANELAIQCQPLASRGDNDIMWPASVRQISAETVVLVLKRRFEPRTGLSVFLPDPGSEASYNVFVRVIGVEAQDEGSWLLECAFLTPLTEERLASLLDLIGRLRMPPPPDPETGLGPTTRIEPQVLEGVLFQVRHGNEEPIRRPVTRLYMKGTWPVRTGQAMKVWVGSGPINESAALIRANGCYKQDGGWLIDCYFLGAPPAILLEKLRTGIM